MVVGLSGDVFVAGEAGPLVADLGAVSSKATEITLAKVTGDT